MGLAKKNNISKNMRVCKGSRSSRSSRSSQSSRHGKLLRGGTDGSDDNGSIFKVTTYKYLHSVLILISYLLFILFTMLFANACIYLHKISTEDQNPSDYYKLRDMPIFEYLKANNFLMLDKFLLNANSNLKPPSIIFWTIVGIVLGSLILLGIHYWFLSKNSELLEYNKNIKAEEFIIICLPYLFIAIIAMLFNTFQLQNIGGLKEIKKKFDDTVESNIISFTAIKAKNTKEDLQNIKKVLQKYIYNTNLTFTIGDFDKYKDDSDNGINIDVGAIFDIYKRNITKKKEKDKPFYDKQFQRKYMNYIDEYFDLLKYNKDNKIEDDYYTDLYLLGIIYYDERNDEDNAYIYQKTRYELKEVLRQIKSNMKAYFGTIIGLYVVMCIGILVYFIVSDNTTKMVIVSLATISNGIALLLGIGSLAFLYFAVL
jgi:hypothetical protein